MAERVVGAVLADSQANDLMFVDRGGQLREMLASAIGIDHVAMTEDIGGVKTYTLYRSADTSTIFGTIEVADGVNGTGSSIPDYQAGTEYEQYQMVIDDDLFAYRYINVLPSTGNKPQVNNVVHANWELVNLGGLSIVHVPANDYAIGDIVLIDKRMFTPINNIVASVAVPVPFVEGYGEDEWYPIAESLFPYHSADEDVVIGDVRRIGNALFTPNSIIRGESDAPVAFVEGLEGQQWRPVGASRNRQRRAASTTTATNDDIIYTETTAGPISILRGPNTSHYVVFDYNNTLTDINHVRLSGGADSLILGAGQVGQRIEVIIEGGVISAYNESGLIAEGNI